MALKKRFDLTEKLEKLNLFQTFLVLIGVVIFFGIIHFIIYVNMPSDGLKTQATNSTLEKFANAIYFSFVTATTAGYGDVTPLGLTRVVSIIEIICGLVLFGVIVSKLISVKQEQILSELYEISFEERVNRLRSALFLFRSDINKVIVLIDLNKITKIRVGEINTYFAFFETTTEDIVKILVESKHKKYSRKVDDLRAELIVNSVNLSLKRAVELFNIMATKKINWRNKDNIKNLENIINHCNSIIDKYQHSDVTTIRDKSGEMKGLVNEIKQHIEAKSEKGGLELV